MDARERSFAHSQLEGKRTDKLARGTSYDHRRDQVARNLEAAWMLASQANTDFRVIVCSERPLSGYEHDLVVGYQYGNRTDGLPHIDDEVRSSFRDRLLTLEWRKIIAKWPAMRELPLLADLR